MFASANPISEHQMSQAVNKSEQFVFDVCRKSFLSLWSYVNPQGRSPDRELCDILIVFDPHVLVISVKDIGLGDSGDTEVDHGRWKRKAVDASVNQIKGAIRWLDQADCVIKKDGSKGLPLPPLGTRIYHRIAVACGGRRQVPISSPNEHDEPHVHVFDERSFFLLLRHLDTIGDFVEYLDATERLLKRTSVVMEDGEENLLALYLHGGRAFPEGPTFAYLHGDLWDGLAKKPEFIEKMELDKVSYVWDRHIELLCAGGFMGENWRGPSMTEAEQAVRVMAREDRFGRRMLGRSFLEFIELSKAGRVRSRLAAPPSGVKYVFFAYDEDSHPEDRRKELVARCFASLCRFPDASTVVGLSMNVPGKRPVGGFTYDLVLLQRIQATWPEEFMPAAKRARDDLGYFKKPEVRNSHEDEYPVNTDSRR